MIKLLLLLKFLKHYNNELSNRTRPLNNFNSKSKNLKTSINNCFALSTKTPNIYNRELKPYYFSHRYKFLDNPRHDDKLPVEPDNSIDKHLEHYSLNLIPTLVYSIDTLIPMKNIP